MGNVIAVKFYGGYLHTAAKDNDPFCFVDNQWSQDVL